MYLRNSEEKSFTPIRIDGALTIDLEDWKCALDPDRNSDFRKRPQIDEEYIKKSTRNLLHELDEAGAKATFFVLGEVALAVPEIVEEVSRRGHEIASHSPVHLPIDMIPRDDLEKMIRRDMLLLEELAKERPKGFRVPYLSISRTDGWLLELLTRIGFLYDSSVAPTMTPYWGIPSAPKRPYRPDFSDIAKRDENGSILELPLTVWPSWQMLPGLPIAGGFYMRAWPVHVLKWMLGRNVAAGIPLNLYIHQGNLESDKQLVPRTTIRDRISQYAWTNRGMSSFRAILSEFRFGSLYAVNKLEIDLLLEERART